MISHDQIDKLEGRDLDAAVAVTLFGWEWQRELKNYFPSRNLSESHLCALQPPDPDPHGYERVNYFAPHWEPVAGRPVPEERFSDWANAAVRRDEEHYVIELGLPHFSNGTNMNATWRVVEAVWKTGHPVATDFAVWWTAGGDYAETGSLYALPACEAATAICRATLHALADAGASK